MNVNEKSYPRGSYTDVVDLKKLKFIFSSISAYCGNHKNKINDIEVLEIGCGQGGVSVPLAKLGYKLKSVEVNNESVEYLKEFVDKNNLNNFEVIEADGLNFRDEKLYDFVIISEVIEHVDRPEQLLLTCKSHLKKEGQLVVTCPNGFGPWEIKNKYNLLSKIKKNKKMRSLFGKSDYRINADTHVQFFSIKKILELFDRCDFHVIKINNSDFISIFPKLRKNRLFASIDCNIANYLPHHFSSGWYFLLELNQIDN